MKGIHFITAWVLTSVAGSLFLVLIFFTPSVISGSIELKYFGGGYILTILFMSALSFVLSIPAMAGVWFTYKSLLKKDFKGKKLKNLLSVSQLIFSIVTFLFFLLGETSANDIRDLMFIFVVYVPLGIYAVRKAIDWAKQQQKTNKISTKE